jgi:hypothetical protein
MANEIDLVVLKNVCNEIFDYMIDDLKLNKIDLQERLYWTIPQDQRYKLEASPETCNVGDLIDDFEFVKEASVDADQALPMLFLHIAPILLALATKIESY